MADRAVMPMTGRDCVRTKLPVATDAASVIPPRMTQGVSRRTVMDRSKAATCSSRGRRASTPVGGQIVAEVLVGLIDGDGQSYRAHDPESTPTYGSNDTFTMVHLLTTAGVIAPLP
jgi:hypothetical protein